MSGQAGRNEQVAVDPRRRVCYQPVVTPPVRSV